MSNALDHVRHNCGIAGEEVAEMVDALERQLSEREREQGEINNALGIQDACMIVPLVKFLNEKYESCSAERDELVAALEVLLVGDLQDAKEMAHAALAKVGADKTGEK